MFLQTPGPGSYDQLRYRLSGLLALSARLRPQFAAAAQAKQESVSGLAGLARVTIMATTLGTMIVVVGTTWFVGRRLSTALARAQGEQAHLVEVSRAMERRNGQFQALYQVVTEVSETLSTKYVVWTAVSQARRLVSADMVVLRLLRGDRLIVLGSDSDVAAELATSNDIELGMGLVGRTAKRGKTLRIEADAEAQLGAGEGILGASSGIIVPLIVGARVVGVLECWGRTPGLFGDDDAQILEMMASQVATAIVAADAHEASEHEAHHDALTSLPNRRQLARDIKERYDPALSEGRQVAVAMIDIDHFKRFNDEFGHRIGDITLKCVAEVLRATLRDSDKVYRYGGEEFTAVLTGAGPNEVAAVLERLRAAVGRASLTGEALEPVGPVTISIGYAVASDDARDCDQLIKLADEALYQSKWAGRDRVTAYAAAGSEETIDLAA